MSPLVQGAGCPPEHAHDLRMPDLTGGGLHHRHTFASAWESLRAMGIPREHVQVRLTDLHPAGYVLRQSPAPGTSLEKVERIILEIGGANTFQSLPFGLRLQDDGAHISTEQMLSLFDGVMLWAQHWRDESARQFDIGPEAREANVRWMRMFGMDPQWWETARWYDLALAVSHIHRLAGTEEGLRQLIGRLLGVPLRRVTHRRVFHALDERQQTRLAAKSDGEGRSVGQVAPSRKKPSCNGRLGINAVIGEKIEADRGCRLDIGPLTIQQWKYFVSEAGRTRLSSVIALCLPFYLDFEVRLVAGDPCVAPVLGVEDANSRLGVSTFLGRGRSELAARRVPIQ